MKQRIFLIILIICGLFQSAQAQDQAISYQGKLNDGGVPANGLYDFTFKLYNGASGGTSIGSDVIVNDVQVTNGIFTVHLPFTETSFLIGSDRFLEILVRPGASTGAYTTLSPRQEMKSVPTAINADRALNASSATNAFNLNGIPGNQFVQTNDSRLTDARNPLAGSANYIQNSTVQQTTSNFNVSGTGKAGIFDASTQYNLGGDRILIVTGLGTNVFLGGNNGSTTNTGFYNSFFGNATGRFITSGNNNSFFGFQSGEATTTGSLNTFVGSGTGIFNATGSFNSIFGAAANVQSGNLNFATAIGAYSKVSTDNTIVIGKVAGNYFNVERPADTVQIPGILNVAGNVGIGTNAAISRLQVVGSSRVTDNGQISQASRGQFEILTSATNANFYMQGAGGTNGINFGVVSATSGGATLFIAQFDGTTYQDRIVVNNTGTVSFTTLGAAGATALCRNALNELSACSSSIRYKQNINNFGSGLDLIRRLRPVTFDWKSNNEADLGLIAEEVAEVEPLLTTRNEKGETEGVKYDRVGVVLINAVNEQQAQIERQEKTIREQEKKLQKQQAEIDALKTFVCSQNPAAQICKLKE